MGIIENGGWMNALILLLFGAIIAFLLEWIWDRNRAQRMMQDHEDEANELQNALEQALSAKSAAQYEAEGLQQQVNDLSSRNEALQTDVATHMASKAEMDEQLSNLDANMRRLAASEQANEQLRDQLAATEAKVRELTGQVESLSGNDAAVQAQQNEMARLREQVTGFQETIATLESEKQTLRDRLARTENELAGMGTQFATNQEEMGDFETLRAQNEQSALEIDRLRANLATVTAQSERVKQIEDENNSLRARLESAENELVNEQNRVVSGDVKLQNLADQLTDERMRVQGIEAELETLRSQQAEGGAPVGGGASDVTRLRAELDARERELDDVRAELTSAKMDSALLDTLKRENSDLRSQVSQLSVAAPTAALGGGAAALGLQSATESADSAESVPSVDSIFEDAGGEVDDLVTEPVPEAAPEPTPAKPDRLQVINGIGNVFAKRLNEAGVFTYDQLSKLNAERAIEIVAAKPWQAVDPDSWITQAAELASMQEAA